MRDDITDSAVIDWARNAQPGDVVLFQFPFNEPGDGQAPRLRPRLVLALTDIDGNLFVTLAYEHHRQHAGQPRRGQSRHRARRS